MFSFGYNNQGQSGVGSNKNLLSPKLIDTVWIQSDTRAESTAPKWVGVGAGRDHSIAVASDGSVFACGSNANG